MSTYGYSAKHKDNGAPNVKTLWLLFGLITLFLVWSPFQIALFNGQRPNFEQPIYIAILFSAIIAIVTCITASMHIKWVSHKDTLTILVWFLPLSYGLAYFNAESDYLAINMLLIMSMYAIFYVTSSIITQHARVNRTFNSVLLVVSYIIVFFGLFHWLGNGSFINALFKWMGSPTLGPDQYLSAGSYRDAVMVDSNGARLTSVFQYANTYAAFLMAFLFAAVFFVGTSRPWWKKALHSFMLVPIILSILLTLSRGGLVLLPVVFIILLLFLKPHRQLMWILHLGVSGVITLIISTPVTNIGLEVQKSFSASQSLKGWAYIIVSAVIASAISLVLERWVSSLLERKLATLANKKWGTFFLPFAGLVVGGLLVFILMGTSVKNMLPDNVQTRLENINFAQHSVLERLTFYKDSAKLVADYPLIGAGGGAWSALYEQYQNNPYTSRQAHSFYMQYLVEVGIIGFALFVAFLGYILYQYIRTFVRSDQEKRDNYFIYFIIAVSILIHSVMDFNMSYLFIGVLVFISLGGMTAFIDSNPLKKLKWNPKTISTGYGVLVGIISIVLLITSITFTSAASSYNKAVETVASSNDYTVISQPLDKALSIRPNHPNYVDMKVSLDTQIYSQLQNDQYYNQAFDRLQSALKAESSNVMLYQRLIALYTTKQMNEEIFNVYQANLYRYQWNIQWYEEYMKYAMQLATLKAEDNAARSKYTNVIFDSFKKIEANIEHLKTLPEGQLQGRPFEITQPIALYVGQAYYLSGKTQEAYDMLKSHLQDTLVTNPDDPTTVNATNLVIMRWYLAAAEKLGLKDEANYAKIIAHDPNEEAKINAIVSLPIQ